MMMDTYDDSATAHVPLKRVCWSFVLCMVADFIPFTEPLYWLPEWSALMLMYWLIHNPRRIGLGAAFVLGLLVDIGTVSPLGSHSLAYCLSSYWLMRHRRQFTLQNYGFQALAVAVALAGNEAVLALVRWLTEHRFAGWQIFYASLSAALLWPVLNKIMRIVAHRKRWGK